MRFTLLLALMLLSVFGSFQLLQRLSHQSRIPEKQSEPIHVSPPGPGKIIKDTYISYQRYHTLSNGAQVGQIGALLYLLTPDKESYSDGYQSIEPTANGYTAKIGNQVFYLDFNGELRPQLASGK